jgi:hypothetical protein
VRDLPLLEDEGNCYLQRLSASTLLKKKKAIPVIEIAFLL